MNFLKGEIKFCTGVRVGAVHKFLLVNFDFIGGGGDGRRREVDDGVIF